MTTPYIFTLGIDISKKTFDVAIALSNGKWKHKKFSNDPIGFDKLETWLTKFDIDRLHACMEATNVYGNKLAEFLFDAGYDVSVVNPARIKGFAKGELLRTKNDKQDASLIARFCIAMSPSLWQPDAINIRELKALVRRLDALISMKQQEVNRLDVADQVIVPDIQNHINELHKRIEQIRKDIKDHIDRDPDLKKQKELLLSIPGVGEATVANCLSHFASIHRFSNAKKMASYCGVAPREFQSGTSVKGRGGMSKIGSSALRKSLFFPAMVALKYNPVMIEMNDRLTKSGKPKMVIIGASMRKLVHIIYGVLSTETPFDPEIRHRYA
jgi:transposase